MFDIRKILCYYILGDRNMIKDSTRTQLMQLYDFLKTFKQLNGYSPSYREMLENMNYTSTATVKRHLELLAELGYITFNQGKKRAIELVDNEGSSVVVVPVIKGFDPDLPLLDKDNVQSKIAISKDFFNTESDLFAVKVEDDLAEGLKIFNGDTVIFKKQSYAKSGSVILAIIDNKLSVCKYEKAPGYYKLSYGKDEDAHIFDTVRVLGVALLSLRTF